MGSQLGHAAGLQGNAEGPPSCPPRPWEGLDTTVSRCCARAVHCQQWRGGLRVAGHGVDCASATSKVACSRQQAPAPWHPPPTCPAHRAPSCTSHALVCVLWEGGTCCRACHVSRTTGRLDGLHHALRGSLPLSHCLSQLVPELHEEAAKLVAARVIPAHTPDVVMRRVLHQGRLPGGQ